MISCLVPHISSALTIQRRGLFFKGFVPAHILFVKKGLEIIFGMQYGVFKSMNDVQ